MHSEALEREKQFITAQRRMAEDQKGDGDDQDQDQDGNEMTAGQRALDDTMRDGGIDARGTTLTW